MGIEISQQKKRIIILSGPMSGLPEYNYAAFRWAANVLRAEGYQVYNPSEYDHAIGSTWGEMVGTCLETMRMMHNMDCVCTLAYLQGWDDSAGATVERALADYYNWDIESVTDILRSTHMARLGKTTQGAAS